MNKKNEIVLFMCAKYYSIYNISWKRFFYLAFGTPDGNALILPKLDGYPTMLVGGVF